MTGDYALISDGVVANMVVCDEEFARAYITEDNDFTHWVFVDDLDTRPAIGWEYDETTRTFIAPPVPPDPEPTAADVAREAASALLGKSHRTLDETTHLIAALAELAGVTPEDA